MTNTTSKTPNDDLLAEVAKYNQHFGNLRIVTEGGQPTYANVLIDRLAARVRELEAENAALRADRERLIAALQAVHDRTGCWMEGPDATTCHSQKLRDYEQCTPCYALTALDAARKEDA